MVFDPNVLVQLSGDPGLVSRHQTQLLYGTSTIPTAENVDLLIFPEVRDLAFVGMGFCR